MLSPYDFFLFGCALLAAATSREGVVPTYPTRAHANKCPLFRHQRGPLTDTGDNPWLRVYSSAVRFPDPPRSSRAQDSRLTLLTYRMALPPPRTGFVIDRFVLHRIADRARSAVATLVMPLGLLMRRDNTGETVRAVFLNNHFSRPKPTNYPYLIAP